MNTEPTTFPPISEIKDFFFTAALATYAGGTEKTTIADLPRSKVYRFEQDGFLYIDTFFTNGEFSGGQTVIYLKMKPFKPIWIMQYQGWCKNDDPEVIGLLKQALCNAYEQRSFCGGRGPQSFSSRNDDIRPDKSERMLGYRNVGHGVNFANEMRFEKFAGTEFIDDIMKSENLFWHRYQGMLLIPTEKGETK